MLRFLLLAAFALIACSPTLHEVRLVNNTPRTRLAPNASASVKVPAGNVEVLAVSEKIQVDATTRETLSASYVVELKGPVELVFNDSTQPAPKDRPGLHVITFRVPTPPPSSEPAPEAPAP
jgi:hypothetical protein